MQASADRLLGLMNTATPCWAFKYPPPTIYSSCKSIRRVLNIGHGESVEKAVGRQLV